MSKAEEIKEKVTVDLSKEPLLGELGLPDLLRRYRQIHLEEKLHEARAKEWHTKKKPLDDAIQAIAKEIGADIITGTFDDLHWRSTLVQGDPNATKTDTDKLMDAMGRIGKLDAGTIAKIFKAAQVPAPRVPYVLVTTHAV